MPDPAIISAALELIGRKRRPGLTVLGICGAQGSGKSTLAQALRRICDQQGIVAETLSLDDLYLTRAERTTLANRIHPLLATRGVPGTHDVALGLSIISQLQAGRPVALPRFDKAQDDRLPEAQWPLARSDCQLLLFEGWCVGARPQDGAALREPVNALERDEDAAGVWRRFANRALATDYQQLFARIDAQILLAAPGFDVVFEWRLEQEGDLAAAEGQHVMGPAQIARFIQHYERLTRHVLAEMPERADVCIRLDQDRQPLSILLR